MTSASDTEMEYLTPSFDPSSLTVPRLRAILVSHDISYPASAKKPQLIDIFNQELVPRSRRILAARSRTKRTSKGIIDMPSSQEETVEGDYNTVDEAVATMPPPPVPETLKRKPRKSDRTVVGNAVADQPVNGRLSSGRKITTKHARPSDTETEPELEPKRSSARKTRKSEATPTMKIDAPQDSATRPSLGESTFSDDNPFQSGSSPLAQSESRRRSTGANNERRKCSPRRRKTEGVGQVDQSRIKQEDGVVVPSVKTFEVPVARLRKSRLKEDSDDGVEIGEEFTPEEQLELVRERSKNNEKDVSPPRKKKRPGKPGLVPKSAPWVIIMTLLTGYGLWWRREKLEVGYCGIGRPSNSMSSLKIPEWTGSLQPQCEPCPQHAICYEGLETRCEVDYVLEPHPLSLKGLVPLPPTCEPDGEKVRRIKVVADRAIEELRDRKAKWECGTLVDDQGKSIPTVELDEKSLKKIVGRNRRRGMTEVEFEDLWNGALGEIIGREEVVQSIDERNSHILLASTSFARLDFTCALRRSFRLALARYRVQLASLTLVLSLLAYARSEIQSRQASNARVPALVATTLDRLATQAALHGRGDAAEAWISIGQLRDDVLRDEFSAARREGIWRKVRAVVEMNANVRTSVREGRSGEVSRVWEWIGSVGLLSEDTWSAGRRSNARNSLVGPEALAGGAEFPGGRSWDEGRPIY